MKSESITAIREISAEVHGASWWRWCILAISGFLLVFAPLAYGAVHTWAYSVVGLTMGMMSLAVLSFGLFNLMAKPDEKYFVPRPPLWWLACGVALIVFLQVMPWPAAMTKWLSPEAWKVRALGSGLGLADYLPFSLNPYKSLLEILKLWPAVTLFFILIYTLNSRRQIRTMMGIIIGVAFLETLYGFAEFRSHLIWGWENLYTGSRLCGTLINSNHLATLLTMAVLLGFGLFLSSKPNQVQNSQGPGVWTNLRHKSRAEHIEPQFRRFLLLFVLLLITVGLIFTGSRSGMTALVIGFAIMGMLIWGQRWRRGNMAVIAVFLAAAVIYSLVLGSAQSLARFQDLEDSGRYYAFSASLQIFRQFPLLGSGLSTFADVFSQYEPASLKGTYFVYAHSDWLQLLAESGALRFCVGAHRFPDLLFPPDAAMAAAARQVRPGGRLGWFGSHGGRGFSSPGGVSLSSSGHQPDVCRHCGHYLRSLALPATRMGTFFISLHQIERPPPDGPRGFGRLNHLAALHDYYARANLAGRKGGADRI